MRLSVVVQRYGEEVLGGAETLARQVAERLAATHEVEVLTSCALDYTTWANHYPPGESMVGNVRVHRFPTTTTRSSDFGALSARLYAGPRTLEDEVAWLHAQGPVVPGLLARLSRERLSRDVFLFFTYIYYPTVLGLPLVHDRALLVPTAHDEPPLDFGIYRRLFHAPRVLLFNTEEERELVQRRFWNDYLPARVAGIGVEAPSGADGARFRQARAIEGPYLLYLGRIVSAKGCDELFDFYRAYRAARRDGAALILLGQAEMAIPELPGLRHVGFVGEEEKWDAIAGATAVVVPSRYESLSIAALEGWALGIPVLSTAASPVVAGMIRRAGGGLLYADAPTFRETVRFLQEQPTVARALGTRGRDFVTRQYSWPSVERAYSWAIDRIAASPWDHGG